MDRYFTTMTAAIERHGGMVEKFIGDAVMAVFGLPRLHEDDALRAVRAAQEMRQALTNLNSELKINWGVTLAHRIGVNTGEVVVGDATMRQRLATGDAVNVAARLEGAAKGSEVLLGQSTYGLVRDAVVVEDVEPLALKGKSERLPAFRLLAVKRGHEGVARRLDAPLVGRAKELHVLLEALDRGLTDGAGSLALVVGEPGIGKSRLVFEVERSLAHRATVLTGRCLPYGEGEAFRPLAELIRAASGIGEDDSREVAVAKLRKLGTELPVVERVASAIGLSGDVYPMEEMRWALHRVLQACGRRGPLAVVIEDLHWAEPTLLDGLAYVLAQGDGAPSFVCTARPELLEERPAWMAGISGSLVLRLEPLAPSDTASLVRNLLSTTALHEEVVDRVLGNSEGNPLYVEQVVSMWVDEGVLTKGESGWSFEGEMDERWIPPSLSALLSARLDRLPHDERTVVSTASVVGQRFHADALRVLCPDEIANELSTHLAALTAKEFVRPHDSSSLDELVFAFRHGLVRDAAYAGMLKRTRAELHEGVADWLAGRAASRIEGLEEVLGYHLDKAYRYKEELGTVSEGDRSLASRAAVHLAAAGRRALERGGAGATSLLKRAVELASDDDAGRANLLLDLAESLRRSGQFERAVAFFREGVDLARSIGHQQLVAKGTLYLINIRVDTGHLSLEQLEQELADLQSEAGRISGTDEASHAEALLAGMNFHLGMMRPARERFLQALRHADRANSQYGRVETRKFVLLSTLRGPQPVHEMVELASAWVAWADDQGALSLKAAALACLSVGATMRGDASKAQELLAQVHDTVRGFEIEAIALDPWGEIVTTAYMLEGRWAEAEVWLRRIIDTLKSLGLTEFIGSDLSHLGEVLLAQGRIDEAEAAARGAASVLIAHEPEAHVQCCKLLAKVLARQGAEGAQLESVRLARDAVDRARATDMINLTADALCDLSEVLTLNQQGRVSERRALLKEAVDLYEAKGNLLSAARARSLVAQPLI